MNQACLHVLINMVKTLTTPYPQYPTPPPLKEKNIFYLLNKTQVEIKNKI